MEIRPGEKETMTTDETRKLALDALKLVRDCKITLRDQAVVDAAIAAIEQYKPVVRMLTDEEAIDCECDKFDNTVKFIQRKFAEKNGLTIGEHG